jgi:ArsR family transcriptional regulator
MMAEIFKALGDPVRLRLFQLLASRDELCVCHLTEALKLPQSTVSRHLGVLRHAGLVQTRREGKWMHYRLTDGLASRIATLILEFSGDEPFQKDRERLRQALG